MKKGNTESHAETRSSRRESKPPTSAFSAPPREKKFGWQTKTFGEVLEIRNGRNQREVESTDGEFPIYGSAGNVMGMATDYICEAGTTIIGRKGNINSPIYADTRFWNVDTAFGLAAKAGMDSRFLYFFCLSYDFSAHNRGTTIPSLVKSELLNIPIPVPPLAEQQRIVGLMDEAFEGLATAKANAEKNLQNARALFESHLQSVFTQRGPGWVETMLGEAYDVRDGTHDSPKYHATGYPLITSKNLKREGLSFDDVKLISEQDYTKINERSAVHKGDVLFAMIGTIGNPTLVEVEPSFAIKNVALFKNPKGQSGAFLKHYLDSGMVISKMMKEAKGTTQKFVGLGYLRGFPIKLPPLATQLKIVEELDELAEETQRLARLYERKHAALEALKKSLLHQAFTGEL